MRTGTDLQRAFALLEELADHTEQHGGAPAAAPRRARWLAPASVAAAVAVGAAAIAVASRQPAHKAAHQQAATAPRTSAVTTLPQQPKTQAVDAAYHSLPLNRIVFAVDRPGTKVAGAMPFDSNGQSLDLTGPDGSYEVALYTDAQPAPATKGTPAPVNGRPGVYGEIHTDAASATTGIAWQYAPGAWATLTPQTGTMSRAKAVMLASAVDVHAPTEVRVPVSLAGSETSLALWNVSYGIDPAKAGQHGDWSWNALFNLTYRGHPVTLALGTANVVAPTGTPDTHVGSDPAYWNAMDGSLTVVAAGTPYTLDQAGNVQLTETQLVQLAGRIHLADRPADPSTWFPTTTALP